MAWVIRNALIGSQAIADTSTTQRHPLGTIVTADDPTLGVGEFIYLLGVASTTAGDWVTYAADDWTTTKLAADAIGPVAVAMSANVASQYGWYQIEGKVSQAHCLTSFADDALVFITASVGYVDDTSVAGDLVNLARGASTSTARAADFEIHRPFVNNNSNSGA